jgi:apolipoprotein N-acyltransferase
VAGWLLAAAPALLFVGSGALVLRAAERTTHDAPPVDVAIVQGNLDLGSRWRSDFYGKNLDVYLRLTRLAIEREDPAVVFWPEAAMTFLLDQEPKFEAVIRRVLDAGSTQLVAGGVRVGGSDDSPTYFNSVFLVDSDAPLVAYDKQHLVPFTEYFPLRSIELLRRRFDKVRSLTPGGPPALLPTRAGLAGVAICNETLLPEVVSERVSRGAEILVNPSNDSWIPDARFAEQQLDVVVLRAVEQRRWLVRVSTSGPSAIVDPHGRVLGRTPLGERKVLIGYVRPRQDRTVYSRVGDLFGALCLTGTVLAVALPRALRRRRTGQE